MVKGEFFHPLYRNVGGDRKKRGRRGLRIPKRRLSLRIYICIFAIYIRRSLKNIYRG